MLYRYSALTALSALLLASCGGSEPATDVDIPPAVSWTVTAEMETGVDSQRMTIIPNDVAPWLSQIVLISTEGELYQTSLDSGKAKPLNTRAKDALGLMRIQAAGVVLLITQDGTLSAMIESNDAGDLAPLPVSAPPMTLSSFCHGADAPTDTIWALSGSGERIEMAVLVEDAQIRLSELSRMAGDSNATACVMTNGEANALTGYNVQTASVSDNGSSYLIIPRAPKPHIQVNGDDFIGVVQVEGGISTPGLRTSNAALVSNAGLGSVFRDGVIILSDAEAQRLVLLAKPFALQSLSPPPE